MNVQDFLAATGLNAHRLALLAGLSYKIVADAAAGATVGLKAAEKLAAVHVDGIDARMSIAALIGLDGSGQIRTRKADKKKSSRAA